MDDGRGPVDVRRVLRDRRGADVAFEDLKRRSADQEIGGVVVRVAGLDDIIEAKEHAAQQKDREALPELRRLRNPQSDADV